MSRKSNGHALASDPADYTDVVGKSFAAHDHAALLSIGAAVHYDRITLGKIGAPHPGAAVAVNRVVKELRITSIPSLAKHVHELGAYKGLGITAYWVVLAVLRAHGYDVHDVHAEPVTYATVKARARRAALKAVADKRRKRRAGPPSDSDNP